MNQPTTPPQSAPHPDRETIARACLINFRHWLNVTSGQQIPPWTFLPDAERERFLREADRILALLTPIPGATVPVAEPALSVEKLREAWQIVSPVAEIEFGGRSFADRIRIQSALETLHAALSGSAAKPVEGNDG